MSLLSVVGSTRIFRLYSSPNSLFLFVDPPKTHYCSVIWSFPYVIITLFIPTRIRLPTRLIIPTALFFPRSSSFTPIVIYLSCTPDLHKSQRTSLRGKKIILRSLTSPMLFSLRVSSSKGMLFLSIGCLSYVALFNALSSEDTPSFFFFFLIDCPSTTRFSHEHTFMHERTTTDSRTLSLLFKCRPRLSSCVHIKTQLQLEPFISLSDFASDRSIGLLSLIRTYMQLTYFGIFQPTCHLFRHKILNISTNLLKDLFFKRSNGYIYIYIYKRV